MRVLILGGTGMLGHKLWQECSIRFEAWAAIHRSFQESSGRDVLDAGRVVEGVEAADFSTVESALAQVQPEVVVNCIGIVKQSAEAKNPIPTLAINALFPHRLARACRDRDIRLIHISTDCVFSGRRGMYTGEDASDAEDLYGRSKFLGEVEGTGCLTLRTSFIGPELSRGVGLLEWLLSQPAGADVPGYTHAIYTGFTSQVLAGMIREIIALHPELCGIYHLASAPISKYDLLCMIKDQLALPVSVRPASEVRIDRSLNAAMFFEATGMRAPGWEEMIQRLAVDREQYESRRLE